MITDEMIKTEFISQTVSRDIKRIYEVQEQVVREVFTGGTGSLAKALSKKSFNMSGAGVDQTFYMRIFPYLRFLDIRYRQQDLSTRRKLALYNRAIWGILYGDTLNELKFGLTDELLKKIGSQLRGKEESDRQMSFKFE